MEADKKQSKLVQAKLVFNEAGDDASKLGDEMIGLQGGLTREISLFPNSSMRDNSLCAQQVVLEKIFAMQISRRPRTSVGKKRKRAEIDKNVEVIGDNIPNVVIKWKNWWAYEGGEDKDLEKLIDKRRERRRCERLTRFISHLKNMKSSSMGEEEFNILRGYHNRLHNEETKALNGLNVWKEVLFTEQRCRNHDVAEMPSQIDIEEVLSLASSKEKTGLECLRSAYSGKSDESIEENYSFNNECSEGLLKQDTKNDQQLADTSMHEDITIICPSSSASIMKKQSYTTIERQDMGGVNKRCRNGLDVVALNDEESNHKHGKKVFDDVHNEMFHETVRTSSNGTLLHHKKIMTVDMQMCSINTNSFEYTPEDGVADLVVGSHHLKRSRRKAAVERESKFASFGGSEGRESLNLLAHSGYGLCSRKGEGKKKASVPVDCPVTPAAVQKDTSAISSPFVLQAHGDGESQHHESLTWKGEEIVTPGNLLVQKLSLFSFMLDMQP
ncbi:hypothetical protein O6H91_05G121900 [Diphasiastrum complanatum]|uniref:Uncharacterized protein n=1 Tax=Diphasiastrum complanatum TaxID=34168 RepID=A0ACC2DSM8_DIPCM|nr:hypothetical protein O6H91_05G121900 [Diphasiastrum complanatum]